MNWLAMTGTAPAPAYTYGMTNNTTTFHTRPGRRQHQRNTTHLYTSSGVSFET